MIQRSVLSLLVAAAGLVALTVAADAQRALPQETPAMAPVAGSCERPVAEEPGGLALLLMGGVAVLASQGTRRKGG